MKPEILKLKAAIQILKPVNKVFEAIVNPEQMTKYFISRSDGRMEAGKTVYWEFPEFTGSWPVRIDKVDKEKLISFYWDSESGQELHVNITLEPRDKNATVVRIEEGSMKNNEEGIKWLLSNTEGWTNFLCCLKAYLEYGINLRKGGYDFLSDIK